MAIIVKEIIEVYLSDWVTINPRAAPPLYSKFIRWITDQRSSLFGLGIPTGAEAAPSAEDGQ